MYYYVLSYILLGRNMRCWDDWGLLNIRRLLLPIFAWVNVRKNWVQVPTWTHGLNCTLDPTIWLRRGIVAMRQGSDIIRGLYVPSLS